jgi:hypothetical protein
MAHNVTFWSTLLFYDVELMSVYKYMNSCILFENLSLVWIYAHVTEVMFDDEVVFL